MIIQDLKRHKVMMMMMIVMIFSFQLHKFQAYG